MPLGSSSLIFLMKDASENAIGKGVSHCGAGVKRAENLDGLDGGAGKLRRYVVGDPRQADDLDLQHVSGGQGTFKVCAAEMLQSQHKGAASDRSLDLFAMYR